MVMPDGFFLGLLSYALDPFYRLLQYFGAVVDHDGITDETDQRDDEITVIVKTPSNGAFPLTVKRQWTIKDVKELLLDKMESRKTNEKLAVIFAGRALADDVLIESCDLGRQTVIHVATVIQNEGEIAEVNEPLNQDLKDLQLSEEEPVVKANFFVYCKNCPDRKPSAGKLRVRCSVCQEGSIILKRDPSDWSDVLQPRQIAGRCVNCDNSDAPVEFFFKCASDHDQEDHQEVPPLYQIRSNIRDAPCLACSDVEDPVLVFECRDRHVICFECFCVFVRGCLQDRHFVSDQDLGYTLPCPVGCPNSLMAETKHFLVMLDEHEYQRYQQFAAEECLLKAGGVICPQPDCGMGIIVDDASLNKIECHSCQFVFCRNCHSCYHEGDCQQQFEMVQAGPSSPNAGAAMFAMDAETVARARWQDRQQRVGLDASSLMAIKLLTKPCPQCKAPTERDGGCMHMECSRCEFQWCWLCQTKWTRECMASHWFN